MYTNKLSRLHIKLFFKVIRYLLRLLTDDLANGYCGGNQLMTSHLNTTNRGDYDLGQTTLHSLKPDLAEIVLIFGPWNASFLPVQLLYFALTFAILFHCCRTA